MFKKRTRTISFRVSEEEYHNLQNCSLVHGAHSISDYARAITCHDAPLEAPKVDGEIRVLRAQVREIKREVSRLREIVESGGQ